MIRDAVWVGLLPEQILETRLFVRSSRPPHPPAPELPTATYVQKAAQAADEDWQQTIEGLQGPGVANPETPQLRLPRGGQRRHGPLSAPEEPSQSAAAPSAVFTTH